MTALAGDAVLEDDVMEEQFPDEMTLPIGSYCGDVLDRSGRPVGLWALLAVDDMSDFYRRGRDCRVEFTAASGVQAMDQAIKALTVARDSLALLPGDAPVPEVVR